MWIDLIKKYWLVSCFKTTPENTPCSSLLLGMTACVFYVLVVIQWLMVDVDHEFSFATSLIMAVVLLFSYASYTYGLLFLFRFSHRFLQSLTSLLAGHTIVHLFALPLVLFWWWPWLAKVMEVSPIGLLFGMIYLVLSFILGIWQVMITVHIYKHALNINYFAAVLASFGLIACNILLVSFWR